MRRALSFIRFIPILMICIFIGIAFARVYEAERVRANKPQLPTPVGQIYLADSFATKLRKEMGLVWLEFYNAVAPGLVPIPSDLKQSNPNSLDALKSRSRRRITNSYAPTTSY